MNQPLSLKSILARMREFGIPLNPPASAEQLLKLEKILGREAPEPIRRLYSDHNGSKACELEYRLYPIGDEFGITNDWAVNACDFKPFDWHPFWTNDNSDFAGLCLSGPLAGLVIFVDHDGEPFYPAFRSVERFYVNLLECFQCEKAEEEHEKEEPIEIEHGPGPFSNPVQIAIGGKIHRFEIGRLNEGKFKKFLRRIGFLSEGFREEVWVPRDTNEVDEREMHSRRKDFGRGPFLPTEEFEEDRARVKALWDMSAKLENEARIYCFQCICALTPRADSASLMPLMDDRDFYVASNAVDSLAARRFAPAYEKFKHLALHGKSNTQFAALRALKYFPGPETLEYTLKIMNEPCFKQFGCHDFLDLLAINGCEVRYTKTEMGWKNHRYRLPNSKKWLPVEIGNG